MELSLNNDANSKKFLDPMDKKNRHVGIAYTAFGWFLIALSSVFFTQTRATHSIVNSCFHHYLFAFMTISLWAAFKNKKTFFCKNPFLIILNSLICMFCYYVYFLLKVAPASISNSYLLNADSIIVGLITAFYFRKKIAPVAWAGIIIGFIGIMCFFSFSVDFSTFKAISDGFMCLVSAFALAVLVLLTQYLLKNNPPIVIALSHCLIGLCFTGVFLYFSGWQLPTKIDLFCMVMDGFMYGISLYFFINALACTEAYIVMSLGYLLPVYLILINMGLHRGGVNQYIVMGILLIVLGVVLVPISEYRKEYKKQMRDQKTA